MKRILSALFLLALFAILPAAAADLVTPPAGIEAKTYHFMGYSFRNSDNLAYQVRIARSGAEIYVQGLYDKLPDAWVKGTVGPDGKATFASGQYLGEVDPQLVDDSHEQFGVYLYGSTDMQKACDFVLDYNPANDTYEALYQYLLFSEEDDLKMRFEHLQNITAFSGRTELVCPPADLATQPFRLCGYECSLGKDLEYSVNVGRTADKVYVQGISTEFPDAWIEGTVSGNTVTFVRNQYLGVYGKLSQPYDIWLTCIDHDDAHFTDLVFDYDVAHGTYTLREGLWLVVNGDPVRWKWLNNITDLVLYPDDEPAPTVDPYALVIPPADATTTPFLLSGADYSFGSPDAITPYSIDLAFTTDSVYLRGLFADIPEAWVRGTFDGTDLTITSPQYLGKWFGTMDCWLMAADSRTGEALDALTFRYDADSQAFVLASGQHIYFNDDYTTPSEMAFQMLGDVVLSGELPVGITAPAAQHGSAAAYTLQGQRVASAARPAITISGGRKMLNNGLRR